MPILVGILAVAALAAAVVLVLHLRNSGNQKAATHPTHTVTVQASKSPGSSSASQGPQAQPGSSGPAAVVKAFYRAINNHNYGRAWQLNHAAHSISSYAAFTQGYTGTAHVTVTITGVSGDVVSIQIASLHTDGTTMYYQGSYTVRSGAIVTASVRKVG